MTASDEMASGYVYNGSEVSEHRCDPPDPDGAPYRSVWRCECGVFWRLTFEPWRRPSRQWKALGPIATWEMRRTLRRQANEP